MKNEFNLSNRIKKTSTLDDMENISINDVKEFIRRLKELLPEEAENKEVYLIHKTINQLAGDKLK